ncbi:MAG: sigma-70 family RNA polymerase sigma factor [Thermoleophilia bacterium]
MHRLIRADVPNAEDALDLTAETFAQALASIHRFRDRGEGSAAAWLYAIARNLVRMHWRRDRVHTSACTRLGMRLQWQPDEVAEIERRIDAERMANAPEVASALESLSAVQRGALVARVSGEQSYEEIAGAQNCSPEVARSRVSRALATVRSALLGGLQ